MTPKVLDRSKVYSGYMTVERLRVRLADGAEVVREIETHGDAVAVLPYDPDRRVALLVRLFRAPAFHLYGQESLEEVCAGMLGGEDPETAGRREAFEELGLRLGDLEFVARVWPSPGVSGERVSLFLAAYASSDRVGDGGGVADEHEDITVIERPLSVLAADADAARIVDAKLLTLVLALRARHPALFLTRPG
jgi:nudix-type nucleoside diphosphatase (YffH/AdpP family)